MIGMSDKEAGLLRLWGQVNQKTVTWSPLPGQLMSVTSAPTPDMEKAIGDAWRGALRCGYTPPKWWQWWRWGEERMPILSPPSES